MPSHSFKDSKTLGHFFEPLYLQAKLPNKWKIHPVFHIDLLTKYREMEIHGENYSPPPPNIVDGEEEQEVEKVVNKRVTKKGAVQYLVKWKCFLEVENEWLSCKNMHADTAIANYEQQIRKTYKDQEIQVGRTITSMLSSDAENPHTHPLRRISSSASNMSSPPLPQPLELHGRADHPGTTLGGGGGICLPTPCPPMGEEQSTPPDPITVVLGRTHATTHTQRGMATPGIPPLHRTTIKTMATDLTPAEIRAQVKQVFHQAAEANQQVGGGTEQPTNPTPNAAGGG